MTRILPLLDAQLPDTLGEQIRTSHAEALRELRRGVFAEAVLLAGVELAGGVETPIAHKLGRKPRLIVVGVPRGEGIADSESVTITQSAATAMTVDGSRVIRSVRVTAGTATAGPRTITDNAFIPTATAVALSTDGTTLTFEANVTDAVVVYEASGSVVEVRSSAYDRRRVVALLARGFGATITVDVVCA